MSEKLYTLLERLSEMFPKQHYQSELDRYISARYPKNTGDVEHLTKQFENKYYQSKIL